MGERPILGPKEMPMSRRNVSGYFVSWMTTNLSAFRVGSALPSCRCPTVTPQQGAPIDERLSLRTGSFASAASLKHRLACSLHSLGSADMTILHAFTNPISFQKVSIFKPVSVCSAKVRSADESRRPPKKAPVSSTGARFKFISFGSASYCGLRFSPR